MVSAVTYGQERVIPCTLWLTSALAAHLNPWHMSSESYNVPAAEGRGSCTSGSGLLAPWKENLSWALVGTRMYRCRRRECLLGGMAKAHHNFLISTGSPSQDITPYISRLTTRYYMYMYMYGCNRVCIYMYILYCHSYQTLIQYICTCHVRES